MIGLYALYAVIGLFVYPTFLYPFDQTPHWIPELDTHQVEAEGGDVHVVATTSGNGPSVLFFMGNTGALARHPSALRMHLEAGRDLVALQYPGGGGLPGAPAEDILKAQALVAYDWAAARTDGPVIVHGYSMGTGMALHVARHRPVKTVLLDAPFARICEQMSRMSALPACWMPGVQKWDSITALDGITADIQILQGARDDLVLPADSRRLADQMTASGLNVTRIVLEGADHNDMFRHADYPGYVADFIATARK